MIKWNLNRIMAERRVSGKQLADLLGMHPNTIYRLRRVDQMPRLDGFLLNELCKTLSCDAGDLIEYIPDRETTSEPSDSAVPIS